MATNSQITYNQQGKTVVAAAGIQGSVDQRYSVADEIKMGL